jgi:omega-6 fatty acid desaturase (delta-12 desaturase)
MPISDASQKHVDRSEGAPSRWPKILSRYRNPNHLRSVAEIAVTVVSFAGLWLAMWAATYISVWITLPLAIPAAAFLVRLFMIQHDCSHDAFFRGRQANAWVGRILGVVTMTPYGYWRRTHAMHHASSGNLDLRGIGAIETLTVAEYNARSRWGRQRYRIYRHPAVMFGVGPAYLFLLQYRLPVGLMRGSGWQPWISTMGTNVALAALVGGLVWLVGIGPFLMIHLPIVLIAASIGVWLFYVQHQFEDTHWDRSAEWDHPEAALHGSSHYALPRPLAWLTAHIGVHHVHHLSSRVPFYRLPEVLRDFPDLAATGRLGLWQSFKCVRLVLWDENTRRLVSFNAARGSRALDILASASPQPQTENQRELRTREQVPSNWSRQ